jgi:predicted AlkP superfamily phosphohydrolase/phosphomutase
MRTLAIGLDGCSWNVLEPLLESGELPHLDALRENGAHGVLESTVPFFTGPAWASFATGASPAAHGIYDFMMLRPDGTLSVAHQGDLRRKTYFQQLGQEGRRSVLVNLPLDQDGCENTVIVNSWLTDDAERRILPVGRSERYERLLKAYRTFPEDQEDLDELCAIEQARFDLARELFLAEGWDHFFILFSSTDWFGHVATGAFLAGDPDARAAFLRLYKQIDSHVGWFVERAPDALTTIVSDHGQCEEQAVFRVNAVLHELGFANLIEPGGGDDPFFVSRRPKPRARVRVPSFLGRYRSNPIVRPMALVTKRALRRGLGVALVRAWHSVDRASSRAFSPTDASFAVYTRDCDEHEIREIREALLAVRLKDGRPAVDVVATPEELYGQAAEGDPTLLFVPAHGVRPSATIKESVVGEPAGLNRGCHQRDGILLAAGPGVGSLDVGRCSIYDIAPTMLWAMGAGIPSGGDGRILFEAFDESFGAEREVIEVDGGTIEPSARFDGHSEEVARRLRALGYI